MLRVILVGPLPTGPLVGGVETGVALLLASDLAQEIDYELFNTARMEDKSRHVLQKLAFQLGMWIRFIAILLRRRTSLVHIKTSAGINFFQNASYLLIARVLGHRTILQIHDGTFPDFYRVASPLRRTIVRFALRLPDRVLALSDSWASYFTDISGSPRIAVAPNALDTAAYASAVPDRRRFGIADDAVAVLFMGTRDSELDERKGLSDLVEAVARVRRQHPELLLVLAGPACRSRDLVPVLGTSGWIAVGSVSNEIKTALYRSVDVFALPSEAENMPNTVLEAMAAGLPVIATPVGAIPEMIGGNDTGRLVPLGDRDALATCLADLVCDRELRQRLGRRASERARDAYDLTVLTRRLREEYRLVLA